MVAINQENFNVFAFWSAVLVLKVIAVVALIGRLRFSKKLFLNPDDLRYVKGSKVSYDDPDVERVRRNHLNDLENILPWFIITFIWLTTNPPSWLAAAFIKTFVFSRIVHTFFYGVMPMQPFRAISFFIGLGVIILEAIATLLHYM